MEKPLKILMLEDSPVDAEIVQQFLKKEIPDCQFKLVMTEEDYLEELDQFQPDLILSDNTLPQFTATEALEIFNKRSLPIPFILVTGTVSEEFAARVIKLGADDYILKDRLARLPTAIEAALQKKKAEAELREQQEQLRFKANLLAAVGQAVIGTYMDGSVIYWNNAAEKIYGWSAAEAIGKNILDLTPSQQSKEQAAQITEQLKAGNSWSGEYPVQKKDGVVFPAFVTVSPIHDKQHNLTGIIGVSNDITEQKNAEHELQTMQQQILNQKIQEQKKISRAIIKAQEQEKNHIGQELHDNINQILAGTKMYLNMAAKDNAPLKEMLKYPLELIDSSIEEIRLLSRKQVTPLKDINLEELLRGLIRDLNKSSSMRTICSYNVPNEMLTDDLKLNMYRIIQEQLNNISKHADAKNVDIKIGAHDNAISIVVADDGKGFNVNSKRKGIGISNMINRIESFNGKMNIESSPGNGCKITVIIPY